MKGLAIVLGKGAKGGEPAPAAEPDEGSGDEEATDERECRDAWDSFKKALDTDDYETGMSALTVLVNNC